VTLRSLQRKALSDLRNPSQDDPAGRPNAARTDVAVRWPGASMKALEAGLAVTAIATAILIGLGR